MTAERKCVAAGCAQPADVRLAAQLYCVAHFVATSYDRLDEYERAVGEPRFHEAAVDDVWQFLTQCIERAADLTESGQKLDNLTRARLLDILLRAADVSRHLRRSPRIANALRVLLRCDKLGHAWEEETQTRILSRYGALVECRHAVEIGDKLAVVRLDSLQQAEARVAWRKPAETGPGEIGIELLNCDNFWALNWGGAEGYAPSQELRYKVVG